MSKHVSEAWNFADDIIKDYYSKKFTYKGLAQDYGCSATTIERIIKEPDKKPKQPFDKRKAYCSKRKFKGSCVPIKPYMKRILKMRENGVTYFDIARELGATESGVYRAVKRWEEEKRK